MAVFHSSLFGAVREKEEMEAKRTENPPKIDGKLDDSCWDFISAEKLAFYQNRPNSGEPSEFQTQIQVVYTDYGIYVAAKMYDPHPENIKKELGIRDDLDKNADQFGVWFDTYNGGQNAFAFIVTAAGVQADVYLTSHNEDESWDAVWKSDVGFDEDGWTVEMEIPYSALRFPKKDEQLWGINFMRQIQDKGEQSFWNFVDNSVDGLVNQEGELKGVSNITPPLRLFFNPFVATTISHDSGSGLTDKSFSAGMDLKYGINESFTLDLSLIPDFSQVRSDNIVLNLSPYEVKFDENRPFFTEGTELFSKAGIFFSRRIGKSFGDISIAGNEEVISSPSEAPLINATKISGRTKHGLGIGFLNAMTGKTTADVRNIETGIERKEKVDPFTNFNVFVLDQSLKNNSNIGIINTNVTRADGGNDANVTAMDFRIFDKSNKYRFSGYSSLSQVFTQDSAGHYKNDVGYSYDIDLRKSSGTWQYGITRHVESDTYNINDLGFLRSNNEISHDANISYNVFKPFWKFNRYGVWFGVNQNGLYKPQRITGWQINLETWGQLKNFWFFHIGSGINPGNSYDYFEPRTDGYYFTKPGSYYTEFYLGSDERKAVAISAFKGFWRRPEWSAKDGWLGAQSRFRINNKLSFTYELNRMTSKKDRGFATTLDDGSGNLQSIIFGIRDIKTVGNVLGVQYTFNRNMGVNARVRHNWTTVDYDSFYELTPEGNLVNTFYTGLDSAGNSLHNTNFNAFNVDLVYTWQIAPGSFVNLVYKNAIISEKSDVTPTFFENFGQMITSSQVNSFSLKIIYFIDYLSLRKKRTK